MQRTNGNLITHLENGFEQVGYVQLADFPTDINRVPVKSPMEECSLVFES
ncbi:hypothetical protein RS130_14700 [Paraglaciecola aquimarina]|uniref:Uncharacterized protein n=1 Tax=Paraglaciecola aquimarina TaxID=1235557 RepID=A0ABU3SY99_9ALTE|nr:hypothetical protein [Paraglaciecola aquimarina]MDU0354985.1 hypothetical protein [Paraglaciecola aquimarina]